MWLGVEPRLSDFLTQLPAAKTTTRTGCDSRNQSYILMESRAILSSSKANEVR